MTTLLGVLPKEEDRVNNLVKIEGGVMSTPPSRISAADPMAPLT